MVSHTSYEFSFSLQLGRPPRNSPDADAADNQDEMEHPQELVDKDYIYVGEAPPEYSQCGQDVSIAAAEEWQKEILEDPKNRLALAALLTNPVNSVLSSRATTITDTHTFNTKVPFEGYPITNQRSSGRCWLFAAENVFRIPVMKKYKLDSFELSQAYLFFWDKVEKANYFFENILDTADEPLDSRLVQTLLASPVGDGGQFTMVKNLVEKYGIVPQKLYPDSYHAMNSSFMNRLITTKLRQDALQLRSMSSSNSPTIKASISAAKEKMLREIHRILTLTLGPPPNPKEAFKWEYYDSNGDFHSLKSTPLEFASGLSDNRVVRACSGTDVHRLFSLVNDPRNEYGTLLTVNRLNNVFGGSPIQYVNVDMSTMKSACIAMIRKGWPVFFGSDVGKYMDQANGILDPDRYDYELGFNIELGLSKAERLMTGESAMTHAMVLTAVHVVDGKPVRWRIQNSWSETTGEKGYFVMSDKWMDEFVYQAVVDPSVVSGDVHKILEQEPKTLNLWDPMGALA